ncbi:MAG: AAA family ATPase, partial [Candidatus Omnitrophota bacterium]
MQGLPIGIQTFEKIVRGGYLYIDKTEYLYNLITKGSVYFLSRPRRFGKSLLISTLNEIFKGNKELFKGLWIDKSDYVWQEYPVIRL